MEIVFIERKTGKRSREKIYGYQSLLLLYGEGWWRRLISALLLPLLSRCSFFSSLYGFLQKRSWSARKIIPFIETYQVDTSEFVKTNFESFNDFFIRKLKPERRPIVADSNILATPADGRYLVYPQFDRFFIKGQEFSLPDFVQNSSYVHHFSKGSMAIVRLCPTDYHRFHFPCDGVPSKAHLINGPLYSVNPMALRKNVAILSQNKRMITEIETKQFGTILYVEIGATSVGSIHQTYTPGTTVHKGDEKGYFEFGASCIVLLFERGQIVFDPDLVENTKQGFETRINFGESLGFRSRKTNSND